MPRKIKGGSLMSVSVSAAALFDINGLKTILTELINLPPKPKTQYVLIEAESFLHKKVRSTLKKNYTKAEIDNLFLRAGWSEEEIKLFWKFYERRENATEHKKTAPKRAASVKTKVISHEDIQDNISTPQSSQEIALPHKREDSELTVQSVTEIQQPLSGAHFELQPDTDDI